MSQMVLGEFVKDENVQVWVVDPSDPSAAIASFSVAGTGLRGKSDIIRIDADKQHYVVNLHLRDYNLAAGKTYLVEVGLLGQEFEGRGISVLPNSN